jgi:hypothetical protein
MEVSDLRERLLAQHRHLRGQINELMAAKVSDSQAELDFRVALATFSDDLARHNREEEKLLSAVVPTSGPWGGVRKILMDDHHASQHAAQLEAVRAIGDTKPFDPGVRDAVARVRRSLSEILAHMELEERELIHQSVLRDEVYAVDKETE